MVGRLGRAGLLEPQPEGLLELITLRDDQLRGYRVQDDSMAPVFRPGQIALVLAAAQRGAAGGRSAATRWSSSATAAPPAPADAERGPDRFDLAAYNAPLLPMVAVSEARSIVGTLWPDAWREAEPAQIRQSAYPLRLMRNSRFVWKFKRSRVF